MNASLRYGHTATTETLRSINTDWISTDFPGPSRHRTEHTATTDGSCARDTGIRLRTTTSTTTAAKPVSRRSARNAAETMRVSTTATSRRTGTGRIPQTGKPMTAIPCGSVSSTRPYRKTTVPRTMSSIKTERRMTTTRPA